MKFWEKTRKQIKLEGQDVIRNLKKTRLEIKTKKNLPKWQIRTKIRELTSEIKGSEEYTCSLLEVHEERIKEALIEGKPIPIEVLKDYPNLKNNSEMKNPLPIGFGARLKELIAEGLPAKEAMKEAWREVKKSRSKTGVYSGSREIFGRKRRKNPTLKFKDLKENDAFVFESEETMPHSGMALGPWIKFDKRTYYKDKALSPGQIRHLIKVGSINVKVIKTGERIFDNHRRKNPSSQTLAAWATKWAIKVKQHKSGAMYVPLVNRLQGKGEIELYRLADYVVSSNIAGTIWLVPRKNPHHNKARKNPIAIYNPPGKQKLLYGRAYIPVIRGIKTSGKYKGERYQHNFSKSNEVSIYGNTDGSITVKSNNNIRLWDYDKDI